MNTATRFLKKLFSKSKEKIINSKWYVKLAAISALLSTQVIAYTAPATGDKGYLFYDVVVNDFLKSGFGFAVAVCIIVISGSKLNTHTIPSVFGIIIGSAMMKSDLILVSFGAMLPAGLF